MKKRNMFFLVVLSFFISLFLSNSLAFAKELKVGYVNFIRVMNSYEKTTKYMKILEDKRAAKEKLLMEKKDKLDKMNEGLSVLSKTEQEKKKKEITDGVKELRTLEYEAYSELKKERDDKMKEIAEDVNNIVVDFSKKGGYDLVFSEAAVIYWDKGFDLTEEIIKLVNQKKPAK